MTQMHPFITLSDEQAFAWYQHHLQVLHSYVLALAQKAGLTPMEAAKMFVKPWHNSHSSLPPNTTAQILEQQARQVAEILALTYGEDRVHLEYQDNTCLLEVTIVDREPLERYGTSLELHTQWLAEQLRLICEPKGIRCSVQLAQETLSLHLSC